MMLSLPNLLTLSRILAVPILVFLLWRPAPLDYAITFVLYCLVGITDYFDGYLARAWGSISYLIRRWSRMRRPISSMGTAAGATSGRVRTL